MWPLSISFLSGVDSLSRNVPPKRFSCVGFLFSNSIAHLLAKCSSSRIWQWGSPCVRTQKSVVEGCLPIELARCHECERGLVCRCPAQQYDPGRGSESPSFPFRHETLVPAVPRLCSFSFFVISKNGSTFGHCSISFSNKSLAFCEISFMHITKVLTEFGA